MTFQTENWYTGYICLRKRTTFFISS